MSSLRLWSPCFAFALAVATSSCGGDSNSAGGGGADSGADLTPFVGQWQVTTGNARATMCESIGDLPEMSLVGTMVSVRADQAASIALTVSGCTFTFDVKDNVATARPSQSCMTMLTVSGLSIPVTLAIDSATFTVTSGSGTLVQTGRAMATMPLMAKCSYQVTATGMKLVPGSGGGTPDAGAADAAAATPYTP